MPKNKHTRKASTGGLDIDLEGSIGESLLGFDQLCWHNYNNIYNWGRFKLYWHNSRINVFRLHLEGVVIR